MKIIQSNDSHHNLMLKGGDRNYKKIKMLVSIISPIKFKVKPRNKNNGFGFIFNFIDVVNKNTCQLSFMFWVMFTLPIKLIKKYLMPRPKSITYAYKIISKTKL